MKNIISFGSWCGMKQNIVAYASIEEPSNPFDYVRSSIEGIIDCIENNFKNYFPAILERKHLYGPFLGEFIGFYHEDLNDALIIDSYNRKIDRFRFRMNLKESYIFMRINARDDFNDEIKYISRLENVLDTKYPNINYIFIFMVPCKNKTMYYKNLSNKTFMFLINDSTIEVSNIQFDTKPVFDFLKENDLFIKIPESNDNIIIEEHDKNILWRVNNYYMVNHIEYNI